MNLNESPILILHGWGSSSKNWQKVKDSLEQKGYKVFVPDLPGFGEEPPPQKPCSVEDYADWVNQWAEKHNLSKFCLVGHSFGGGVAAVFAAKYHQKVEKLVLVSAAIVRQRTLKQYLFFLVSKIAATIFLLPPLSHFRLAAQKLLYRSIGVKDYYRLVRKLSTPAMKETFKKIIREDLRKHLPYISCPTLILWGEKDRLTPLSQARLIAENAPSFQLKILQGRGHALNLEAPEELAEKIHQFFSHYFS